MTAARVKCSGITSLLLPLSPMTARSALLPSVYLLKSERTRFSSLVQDDQTATVYLSTTSLLLGRALLRTLSSMETSLLPMSVVLGESSTTSMDGKELESRLAVALKPMESEEANSASWTEIPTTKLLNISPLTTSTPSSPTDPNHPATLFSDLLSPTHFPSTGRFDPQDLSHHKPMCSGTMLC